jgi:AraC family transcriptional regulator
MSVAAETFSRFVEVLSSTLDDHETTGDELASRVHLSRHHFDRVVAAVGGEPPRAFRRRILLERAGYRLLISDDTILAVAIEAGYSSHEAFARAFRRAYGRTPSEWRRRPSQFRINAPSRVHFHPPGGLRVPAQRKVDAMELLNRMVEHHVWLVGEMLDRADTLSGDVLDRTIEISVEGIDDRPTLRSLLSRLVGQLAQWNAATAGLPYDFATEDGASVGSLRARLAECGPEFAAGLAQIVREDRLDETFVDAVCDPPRVFTYGGMIAHVLTFGAHRRTLVCGALANVGINDLGAGDPMRWVADAT